MLSNPTRGNKVGFYLVVAFLFLAVGLFVWLWGSTQSGRHASTSTPETTLALETFVVNLDSAGQRAYLRVAITIGFSQRSLHSKKEEAPIALIRDAILSVLASAKPEQLLRVEGKQKLKSDLLKTLQERVPELGVENVYFTEFLVQM